MTITAKRRFGRTALLVWGTALVLALSAGTCDGNTGPFVPPEEEDREDERDDDPDDVGFLLLPDGGSLSV